MDFLKYSWTSLAAIDDVVNAGNDLIKNNSKQIIEQMITPFHSSLAPFYGTLTTDSIKAMDEQLKIIIAGPTNLLVNKIQAAQVIMAVNDLIKNNSKQIIGKKILPYHCSLAPSYGTLNRDSIKAMDEQLKIIIASTTNLLVKKVQEAQSKGVELSWDEVVGAMTQNPLLEAVEGDGAVIARSDRLIKEGMNYFKFDGSPDHSIVKEVHSWLVNLIKDEDVIKDTTIDITTIANIVAQTGATINSLETFFYKREYAEQKVVDISILRYPDIDHPYFKVYCIKLVAWSDSTRVVFAQHDANGIRGEFNSRKYKPRKSVIDAMPREVKEKAVKEAESLFD